MLDRLFEELQHQPLVRIKIEAVSLDSTIVKVHPDGTGALKKTVPNPSASREQGRADTNSTVARTTAKSTKGERLLPDADLQLKSSARYGRGLCLSRAIGDGAAIAHEGSRAP